MKQGKTGSAEFTGLTEFSISFPIQNPWVFSVLNSNPFYGLALSYPGSPPITSFPHAQPCEFLHPSIKLVLRPIFRFRIILKEISIPIYANIIRINTIDNSRLRIPTQILSACLSEGRESADEIKHMLVGSRFWAISSTKLSEPEL